MTVLIVSVVAVVVVGAGLLLLRSSGPRHESLGATQSDGADPLIRTESRHHDTPAGADLQTPGGREHDDRS